MENAIAPANPDLGCDARGQEIIISFKANLTQNRQTQRKPGNFQRRRRTIGGSGFVFAAPRRRCPESRFDPAGQRMARQVVPTTSYIFGVSNTCSSLAILRAAAKSVCLRPSLALASAWINTDLRTSSVVSDIAPLPWSLQGLPLCRQILAPWDRPDS
jgi:hypothetical protein